jgi:hypothetical protein
MGSDDPSPVTAGKGPHPAARSHRVYRTQR